MVSPHTITDILRITIAPIAVLLAWLRIESWYLLILIVYLLVYGLNAFNLVRNTKMAQTHLAKGADIATFICVAAGGWLLFPHLIIQERLIILVYAILSIICLLSKPRSKGTPANIALTMLPVIVLASVLIGYYTNNTWPFLLAVMTLLLLVVGWFSVKRKAA